MRSRFPIKLLYKTLLKCPDMSTPLANAIFRKHFGVERDYLSGTGKSLKPPLQISLRITNACNHRCSVCGQYGNKGYMNDETGKHLLKNLPLNKYIELVDQLKKYKPIYYITGGEPFLYNGFMELAYYIKKSGSLLSVVTNGVFLEKFAEKIVENKWDMLMVSFDGPREIHDECRNYPGAFDTAFNGIKKISELKRKYRSVKPFVLTSTTISKTNAQYLKETFDIGKYLSPDIMVVYLSWFTTENIGLKQKKIIEERMGVTPFTWKSYATSFKTETAVLFRKSIEKIKTMQWPFEYMVIPDLKGKEISRYYTEPEETFGFRKCAAPFIMVDIMPNGDVTTCRDFIDIVAGNITEKPLLDIWNGDTFVKFRKLLIENNGLLPQCSRCCGLMGF